MKNKRVRTVDGRKESKNIYPTYDEAVNAVKKLGIKTQTEYKDYRPPISNNNNKNWISWEHFLGVEEKKRLPRT